MYMHDKWPLYVKPVTKNQLLHALSFLVENNKNELGFAIGYFPTLKFDIFKIHNFYQEAPQKLYAGADIERMVDDSEGSEEYYQKIVSLVEELFRLLDIKKLIPKSGASFQTYDLAHHIGFSIGQEYDFLCIPTELLRQEFMIMHLEKLIPIVKETERLRKKAIMNGHFKNVISPDDLG